MKPKIIFIILAVFIAMIIISILLTRQLEKNIIGTETVSPRQETPAQLGEIAPEQLSVSPASVAGKIPAITIIKPAQKVTLPENQGQIENTRITRAEKSAPVPSQGPLASWEEPDTERTEAGVTKIGKTPAEKESREMNAQGIIIY